MDEFIGTVKLFAGSFAPVDWQLCDGRLLPIQQYSAVYAILGTTYGGDGVNTFGLPDLRGRVPVGTGSGPTLTPVTAGQKGGTEKVTLTINELPAHTHVATSNLTLKASSASANTTIPVVGSALSAAKDINTDAVSIYSAGTPDVNLNPASGAVTTTVQSIGNNLPVPIRDPYLGMNYIICLNGIFPSRN